MSRKKSFCPACGYRLGFKPWENLLPADELCPSCGIQFGYDDAAGGDLPLRERTYRTWRKKWVARGRPWNSQGVPKPDNWNPTEQLRLLEEKELERLLLELDRNGMPPEVARKFELAGKAAFDLLYEQMKGSRLSGRRGANAINMLCRLTSQLGSHDLVMELALRLTNADDIWVRSEATATVVKLLRLAQALPNLQGSLQRFGEKEALRPLIEKALALGIKPKGVQGYIEDYLRTFGGPPR